MELFKKNHVEVTHIQICPEINSIGMKIHAKLKNLDWSQVGQFSMSSLSIDLESYEYILKKLINTNH